MGLIPKQNTCIPHICHFFSTGTIFGPNFLHAIARKSRQNDFVTKQRKLQKTYFATKHHKLHTLFFDNEGYFSTSVMWSIWNYSTCREISDLSTSVMWRNVKLLHMWWNFRFLHICHVKKFEISPHDRFFLHGHRPPWPRQISGMIGYTISIFDIEYIPFFMFPYLISNIFLPYLILNIFFPYWLLNKSFPSSMFSYSKMEYITSIFAIEHIISILKPDQLFPYLILGIYSSHIWYWVYYFHIGAGYREKCIFVGVAAYCRWSLQRICLCVFLYFVFRLCFVFVFCFVFGFCLCFVFVFFCVLFMFCVCLFAYLLICLCVCGRCVILPLFITADLLDHQMIITTAVVWQVTMIKLTTTSLIIIIMILSDHSSVAQFLLCPVYKIFNFQL